MPELPEVETVMRGLVPVLVGHKIARCQVKRPDLRFPFPEHFAEKLQGRTVNRLERRAKYILAHLDNGSIWLTHLGMSGRFTIFRKTANSQNAVVENLAEFYFQSGAEPAGSGKHDHVILQTDTGDMVVYTDPRRFGIMDHFQLDEMNTHKLLANIGVEPLGNGFNSAFLAEKLKGRKTPLKSALLDQRIIAGLGNIYVCEALFRAGLSPKRGSATLSKSGRPTKPVEALVRAIRACLNEAIIAGGSTLKDYRAADGNKGGFQQRFDVYGREGEHCHTAGCKGKIQRITQSGRSTFYCPKCQK